MLLPLLLAPRPSTPRAGVAQCAAPLDGIRGIDMQRKLGEVRFEQLTTTALSAETLMRGGRPMSAGGAPVVVSLYYGCLTYGDAAGTRILVKEYSADESVPPPTERAKRAVASAQGAAGDGDDAMSDEERMRARLDAMLGGGGGGDSGGAAGDAPREYSASEVARALAANEFAAHRRLQTLSSPPNTILRCLGRNDPTEGPDLLNVFPWKGEQVRMALPTRAPPTIDSWLRLRANGKTPGFYLDKSVPLTAATNRCKYIRAALKGALGGLAAVHGANMVHCAVGAAAVGVEGEDERKRGGGFLQDLAFARDAPTLKLLRVPTEPAVDDRAEDDPLDSGLRERAARAGAYTDEARAAFGAADDMRAFGLLLLRACVESCAPAGANDIQRLVALTDGPFAADAATNDGSVNVGALREYLLEEDSLRIGGAGGADVLDAAGGLGWRLLEALLCPWEERLSARLAADHPFWDAQIFVKAR